MAKKASPKKTAKSAPKKPIKKTVQATKKKSSDKTAVKKVTPRKVIKKPPVHKVSGPKSPAKKNPPARSVSAPSTARIPAAKATGKKNILITGGTGLIGTKLTELLQSKGYNIGYLSRKKKELGDIKSFVWDLEKEEIDVAALKWANIIINLAGESIGARRWNEESKKKFISSRVDGIKLLREAIIKNRLKIEVFISASAIGYYGDKKNKLVTEESAPGNDFLSEITQKWEEAIFSMRDTVSRVACIRIGFVLSNKGGGLLKMVQPVKWFVGAPLGSGRQIVSWIHLNDLCNMFVKLAEDTKFRGVYNGVAPNPVTNAEFTKIIGKVIKRPVFLPAVPVPVLKLMVGEMAMLILNSANISCDKIQGTGFKFSFTSLEEALRDLLG